MDRQKAQILERNGFLYERLENSNPQPFRTYYSRNRETGSVIAHNLPADAYSLNHYLRKGFKLNPDELPPLAEDNTEKLGVDTPKI